MPGPGFPESAMQWINRALVQATRKTAPPNGYRRKEECLSFLTMPDSRVVSVEKPNLFCVFRNDYSQIRTSHYNILIKNPFIRAQTSGQLTASDPIRTTHENIAIYCGELPAANCLFFVKKTKDNRTWVADQEPVNMKRLEPWNRLTICA